MAAGRGGRQPRRAFTLIELLVVVAIVGMLITLLLPALARATEKVKATKVHADLLGVSLALQMYADDHAGDLPPVRVNCNSDLADHWCPFPRELATGRYLGRSQRPGMDVDLVDVFNPGHTYKYAAPGPCLLNDSAAGQFRLWVPAGFPDSPSTQGQYYASRTDSPIRWVIWSLGPDPRSDKSQDPHAPVAPHSWYRRTGDHGVLARIAGREGAEWRTP